MAGLGKILSKSPAAAVVEDDQTPVQKTTVMEGFSDRARVKLVEVIGATIGDDLSQAELRRNVVDELDRLIVAENLPLTDAERYRVATDVTNDLLGYGPLEPLLEDPTISEIMVNGLDAIFVEKDGRLTLTDINFRTESHLLQVIDRIVSSIGRRVDETSPMVDARLPDGSRVNAVIGPLAVDGPTLTIRKFGKDGLQAQDLVDKGSLSEQALIFARAAIIGSLNVIVSGGTGTGKTTFLNVLSSFIPEGDRIVTIEDAVELKLRQRHVIRLECRPPNVEGKGEIGTRDLLRNSLRMRPDRIIVGECRGGEALDMLQAMNTGHDGSLTTLHANSPRDALSRIETLVMMAGFDLPQRAIREQVASAVDIFIQLERMRSGARVVSSITEVVGMEGEQVTLNELFTLEHYADGSHRLKPTGIIPQNAHKLEKHGVSLDASVFEDMGGPF